MNPEEGELRPQLLDRFGLCVQIQGIDDPQLRVAIMESRNDFDEDLEKFSTSFEGASADLSKRIREAGERYPTIAVERETMLEIANLCISVGVDGHRADIVTLKTAKTLCAFVASEDIHTAAEMVLPHRLRRQPFEEISDAGLHFNRSRVS
jgi:magnesium chelatase subunit I